MKIYLVRHGLSIGNKARTHQFPDTGLSEEGTAQAKALAERALKLPIDFIYASNLARAQETAEIIAQKKNLKIETWDDIREIKRPLEIMGKHVESVEAKAFEKAIVENYKDPDWKYSDEESFNDLKARAQKVLNHLLEKHQDQNVLLVSHGTFIKMVIASVLFGENLTTEVFRDFREHSWAENTGVSVCEYKEAKGWRLLTFSDSSHL